MSDEREGDAEEEMTIFERIKKEAKEKRDAFEGHHEAVKGKRFKELLDATENIDDIRRRSRKGRNGYGKFGKF